MKTLTSMAMAALMLAATTAAADPMRDGEPVLTGKIDKFDCQQTLRALTEPEGLSTDLKVEYVDRRNGYQLLTTEVTWDAQNEECIVEWYRKTSIYQTYSHLQKVAPDAYDWGEVDFQSKEGAQTIMRGLEKHLQDNPADIILEPVLKHTENVRVRMMTMYDWFGNRQKARSALNKYHSKNF